MYLEEVSQATVGWSGGREDEPEEDSRRKELHRFRQAAAAVPVSDPVAREQLAAAGAR